jgi:hypothetical protein
MIIGDEKNLVLLSTGRNKNLFIWELKNQVEYGLGEGSLISVTYLEDKIDISSSSVHKNITINGNNTNEQNGVIFRAKFRCIPGDIDILKAALANCILLRYVYEEEVVAAVGIDQLWRNLHEKSLILSVSDIHFIGRRIKVQKIIEQGKAKILPKSKKRKANELTSGKDVYKENKPSVQRAVEEKILSRDRLILDSNRVRDDKEVISEKKEITDENFYLENELKDSKYEKIDLKSNDLNIMDKKSVNNEDEFSINVHLLSDLRGVTNIDEKKTMYYGAIHFCDGGDLLFRNLNKNLNQEKRKLSSSSANVLVNGISSNKSTFPTALSSNSTTTMDFDRCYLTVSSARVIPGAVVVDPFAGNCVHYLCLRG